MVSLGFSTVEQSNKYSIDWFGLENISVADTTGESSIVVGKYATSSSLKVGSIYVTEDLIFRSGKKITSNDTIENIFFDIRVRAKKLVSGNEKVEVVFYLKDIKDKGKGTFLFSKIISSKFTNSSKIVNLSNKVFNFKNEAVIVAEFRSTVPFNVDVDKLVIASEFTQPLPQIIANLQSLEIQLDINNLTTLSDASVTLESQILNITNNNLETIVTNSPSDNFVILQNQEINLNIGNLSTIAPETWLNFGSDLLKIGKFDIIISNSAVSIDISEPWFTATSSQFNNFEEINILAENSAIFTDDSDIWMQWQKDAVLSSIPPQQITNVYPEQTILIFVSSQFTINIGTSVASPWELVTNLSATKITIPVSTVAIWEDVESSAWSDFGLSASPAATQIGIIATNLAFLPQTHGNVIVDYDDLDLDPGIAFLNSPWELWDNHPKYDAINFSDGGIAFVDFPNQSWMGTEILNFVSYNINISQIAFSDNSFFSPNVVDFSNINLFDTNLSSPSVWMNWDNHPNYDIINVLSLTGALINPSVTSQNVIDFFDINLADPALSSQFVWMNWDNKGKYKTFIIQTSFIAVSDASASSTNVIDFFDVNLFDTNLSSPSVWMNWDNHPNYDIINVLSLTGALINPSVTSQNVIGFFDINLADPALSSQFVWMNWDNKGKYKTFIIQTSSNAVSDASASSTNVIDFFDVNLFDTNLSSPSVWMNWDNHPAFDVIKIEASAIAVSDASASSTNVIDFFDVNLFDINLSSPSVWMNWDNHPAFDVIKIEASTESTYTQNISADPGNTWLLTTDLVSSLTLININTGSEAIFDDSHTHTNLVDYIYDIDLVNVALSGLSSWMVWDNHPRWRDLTVQVSSVATVALSAIESPWLLWNGSADSSSFLISEEEVKDSLLDFRRIDNASKFALSYATLSSVRTMSVTVSGFDIQLSPDLKISISQDEQIDSVYVLDLETSSYYITSFIENANNVMTPSYTFLSALNDGIVGEESTGIDLAQSANSVFTLGFHTGNNIFSEYRRYDNQAALIQIEVSTSPLSLAILASANVSIADNIISYAKINNSAFAVNFENTNDSAVIYASSLSLQSVSTAGVFPGALAKVNNGYIQFFKSGSDFKYARYDVSVSSFGAPSHIITVTVDSTAPFTNPNYMKAVGINPNTYVIFAQANNNIYVKAITLSEDLLTLSQQTTWFTFVTSTYNGKFEAERIPNKDEIAVIYKGIDEDIFIKIMKI